MKKPLSYEDFVAIYSKVPRLNVELLVLTDQGVLLTHRTIDPWKGKWHVPGSTVYRGETLEDAVRRTAVEELSSEVRSLELVGYIEYPSSKQLDVFVGWPIGVAFRVELEQTDLHVNEEADGLRYFSELPDDLITDQRPILTKLLQGDL